MSIVRTFNCTNELQYAEVGGDTTGLDTNMRSPWVERVWNTDTNDQFAFTAITEGGAFGYLAPQGFFFGDSALSFRESSTRHFNIRANESDWALHYEIAGANNIHPSYVWDAKRWVWCEIEWKIDDTTGYLKVWLDGTQVINFSGDTKNGGTGQIDNIFPGPGSNGGQMLIYSWVVWTKDSVGLTATPGVGPTNPIRILKHVPTGDSETGWSSTGANHYTEVDDDGDADGDTTRIYSASASDRDRLSATLTTVDYAGNNLTQIHAVIARAGLAADTGTTNIDVGIRELGNDTEEVTSFTGVGTSYTEKEHIAETNPDTSAAWTNAELVTGVEILLEQQ